MDTSFPVVPSSTLVPLAVFTRADAGDVAETAVEIREAFKATSELAPAACSPFAAQRDQGNPSEGSALAFGD